MWKVPSWKYDIDINFRSCCAGRLSWMEGSSTTSQYPATRLTQSNHVRWPSSYTPAAYPTIFLYLIPLTFCRAHRRRLGGRREALERRRKRWHMPSHDAAPSAPRILSTSQSPSASILEPGRYLAEPGATRLQLNGHRAFETSCRY